MAIINHTWKFVFVHIPKCAGTSMSVALEDLCTLRDLVLGGSPFGEILHRAYRPKYGIFKHSYAAELRRVLGEQSWTEYTSFAVFRDPVERTISTFRYLKHHQGTYKFMAQIETLTEFINSEEWQEPGPDRMFMPQTHWLVDHRDLETRIVDDVIHVDDLQHRLPELLVDIGVPKAKVANIALDRLNVSPDRNIQHSEDDIAKIKERYEADYALAETLRRYRP